MHNDVVTSKEFLFSTGADISLAAKPLILRDGSKASIRERTKPFAGCRRPIATAGDLTMEVKNLSAVHTAGTITTTQSGDASSHRAPSFFESDAFACRVACRVSSVSSL